MKKIYWVLLAILLTTGPAFAQDKGSVPEPGSWLIEITTSPFNRDENVSGESLLNFGYLRGRYFLNQTLVPRLGVGFHFSDAHTTPDDVITRASYSIMPGVEYHFLNEGAFTSYGAFDLMINGEVREIESTTDSNVTGSTQRPTTSNQLFSDRGSFGVGGMVSAGADYHFASRFYIGVEIGVYIFKGKTTDVEVDGALFQEGTSFFNGGISTSSSFRIGFILIK